MKRLILLGLIALLTCSLFAVDDLYLSGFNEVTYIYRTAQDSLNSYFRDAFSFSLNYKDFTIGTKFLAELPKYSNEQSQLLPELNANKLSTKWTERYLEFEKDNLILHGGTISESFSSGMVFRAWEDTEFDQDTRMDGFLVKYNKELKLKALYGALPNRNQPAKYDLVYGADTEYQIFKGIDLGASLLTMRTLTLLNTYNQQDVYGGRLNWSLEAIDGSLEYATTSMMKNGTANYKGKGISAFTNVYLKPSFVNSITLGAGYKYYDKFNYRTQDLRTNTYHNETLADSQSTGDDEEGLQGIATIVFNDNVTGYINYAEAWNYNKSKQMNDFYASIESLLGSSTLLAEYGHIEKLDDNLSNWQKNIIPAIGIGIPLTNSSVNFKAECEYIEKVVFYEKTWHYEPKLQTDFSIGKMGLSLGMQTVWSEVIDENNGIKVTFLNQNLGYIPAYPYWVNCEVKYPLFAHTDITLFAGREAGGKVCRNGVCRFVAPFQGIKLEAVTRF